MTAAHLSNGSTWVVTNFALGAKFTENASLYHTALLERGIDSELVDSSTLLVSVNGHGLTRNDTPLQDIPKVVIFLDKDFHMASQLEEMGALVINSARAIEICEDKRSAHQLFAKASLPSPQTIFGPKLYPGMHIDKERLSQISLLLGYPLVVKEAKGSFGSQVYLASNPEELIQITESLGATPMLFQRFVRTSEGRDLRVQVAWGKAVASIKRTNNSDFRANLSIGALGTSYELNDYESGLAVSAAAAVGAEIAGVDLLFGEGEERLICEVNSNAHIVRLSRLTNIDCAGLVAISLRDRLELP